MTDDNHIHMQTHVIITMQTTKLCSKTGVLSVGTKDVVVNGESKVFFRGGEVSIET